MERGLHSWPDKSQDFLKRDFLPVAPGSTDPSNRQINRWENMSPTILLHQRFTANIYWRGSAARSIHIYIYMKKRPQVPQHTADLQVSLCNSSNRVLKQ